MRFMDDAVLVKIKNFDMGHLPVQSWFYPQKLDSNIYSNTVFTPEKESWMFSKYFELFYLYLFFSYLFMLILFSITPLQIT